MRAPSAIPQTLDVQLALGHTNFEANIHGISSPDDNGVKRDGCIELGNVGALALGTSATVDNQVPDDHNEGNAGNGVPSPLRRVGLGAVSSEKTGQDHDDISQDL